MHKTFSFGHCVSAYKKRSKRDASASESVLKRVHDLGVRMDRVVDYGGGEGYWLNRIQQLGYGAGPNYLIDISEAMLSNTRAQVANTTTIRGGIDRLSRLKLDADSLFVCMVAHLLDFPGGIADLARFAKRNAIKKLVLIEDVSFLYHAFAGNAQFLPLLPNSLREVIVGYEALRMALGYSNLAGARSAPLPTPIMPLAIWQEFGIAASDYYHEAVPDCAWHADYSALELIEEIEQRSRSPYFCHSEEEARVIAANLKKRLGRKKGFDTTHSIPFWCNLHIFDI